MGEPFFTTVDVRLFLGIGRTAAPVQLAGLVPGLNVVWAPNARGKTCTAQAMIALLWAAVDEPWRIHARATVEQDGASVLLAIEHEPGTPLAGLPPADLGPLYRMSLPDLLASDGRALAARIRREIHGNIDLARARKDLGFKRDTPARVGESDECKRAHAKVGDVRTHQKQVREDERRLASLAQQRDRLREHVHREAVYQDLLARWDARDARDRAAEALDAFPAGMDGLRAGDGEELDGLLAEFAALEGRMRTAETERARQEEARTRAGFGTQPPPDRVWCEQAALRLDDFKRSAEAFQSAAGAFSSARVEYENAQEREARAAAAVEEVAAPFRAAPRPADIEPLKSGLADWRAAEADRAKVRAERAALDAELGRLRAQAEPLADAKQLDAWLAENAPIPNLSDAIQTALDAGTAQRLRDYWRQQAQEQEAERAERAESARHADQAVYLLEQWLADAAGAPGAGGKARAPASIALALLAAVIAALGVFASPWFLLGLLVPVGLGLWEWRSAGSGRTRADASAAHTFQEAGLDPAPTSWTPHAVAECLTAHLKARARDEALLSGREQAAALARSAAHDAERAAARQKAIAETLQSRLGVAPGAWDALGLSQFAGILDRLRERHVTRAGCVGQEEELAAATDRARQALSALLAAYYAAPAGDLSAAAQQVSGLREAADRIRDRQAEHAEIRNTVERDADALAAAEARKREAEAACAAARGKLQDLLAGWHAEPAQLEDVAVIAPVVDELRTRAEAHRQATAAIEGLAKQLADARVERDRKQAAIDAWLEKRALSGGRDRWQEQRAELQQRLGRLDAYAACRQKQSDAEAALREIDSRLARRALPPETDDLSQEELQEELDRLPQVRADLDACVEQIHEIENDLKRVRQGNELEAALADEDRARAALVRRREQAAAASVGDVLIGALNARTDKGASAVLDNARDLFGAFTRDAYALQVSADADAGLVVHDTAGNENLALEQLSSGTRVQLLVAARLGFLTAQETTLRPPLLLDEALAVSDPDRVDAIMDAVVKVVDQGRQVVYFTAQPDEVDHWRARFPDGESDRFCVHTIGSDPDRRTPPATPWQPPAPPAPAPDEDVEAYGRRLDVPQLRLWTADGAETGAAGAHLWYVMEDAGLLFRALRIAGETCGSLSGYVARTGVPAAARALECAPEELAAVLERIRILERSLQLCRQGRARPLTAADLRGLRDLSGFGAATVEQIAQLVRERDLDAEGLRAAVADGAVRSMGPAKQQALRAFLEENGLLPAGPAPAGNDVARRLRQEFGDQEAVERILARSGLFEGA